MTRMKTLDLSKSKPKRMTIEVDYTTYQHIKKIADKIQIGMDDLLYNLIFDDVLEEYYEQEIRDAEAVERDADLVEEMRWEESYREAQREFRQES